MIKAERESITKKRRTRGTVRVECRWTGDIPEFFGPSMREWRHSGWYHSREVAEKAASDAAIKRNQNKSGAKLEFRVVDCQ